MGIVQMAAASALGSAATGEPGGNSDQTTPAWKRPSTYKKEWIKTQDREEISLLC